MLSFRHIFKKGWSSILYTTPFWSVATLGYLLSISGGTLANPTPMPTAMPTAAPVNTAPANSTVSASSSAAISLCNQSKSKVRYVLNSPPSTLTSGYDAYPFYNFEGALKKGTCQTITNYGNGLTLTFKGRSYRLEPDYNYAFKKLDNDRQIFLYREKSE